MGARMSAKHKFARLAALDMQSSEYCDLYKRMPGHGECGHPFADREGEIDDIVRHSHTVSVSTQLHEFNDFAARPDNNGE